MKTTKIFKKTVRIFLALLLLTLMILSLSEIGFGSSVTYEGRSQSFIFLSRSGDSPTDLFGNLKSVMPGDSITERIVVNNDISDDVKVKLYVRAVGTEGDEEFLSKLDLRVEQDGEILLFEAPASDTAELEDWVYLGTFYSGEPTTLDLILEVPIELDDSFQNAVGNVLWEFRAEEYPVENTDPGQPKTGDILDTGLWLTAGTAAMLLAMIIFTEMRRRKG